MLRWKDALDIRSNIWTRSQPTSKGTLWINLGDPIYRQELHHAQGQSTSQLND